MPTQSSGPISFLNIKNALGTSSPLSFDQLYRGGTYVPDITPNNDIPTTGEINMQEMYNTWGNKTLSFTITVGAITGKKGKGKGNFFGFGDGFGSISNASFLTPNGTMVITALYFDTGSSTWNLQLSSNSSPDDTDLSFRSVSVTGYSVNGVRSSRTSTTAVSPSRKWTWQVGNTSHPTSGTISCFLNYYG